VTKSSPVATVTGIINANEDVSFRSFTLVGSNFFKTIRREDTPYL
jgi:hypothetical protein